MRGYITLHKPSCPGALHSVLVEDSYARSWVATEMVARIRHRQSELLLFISESP